uniref:Uncharacterized protein n=1 Tax=Heliothis virescens TaxID=7102 RepID=A0A2A4K8Y9_HELVI
MYEDDRRSVIIDIPKLRTFPSLIEPKSTKKTIKKQFKRSDALTRKCTLPIIKPLPIGTLKNDEVLLPYMLYSKNQEKERRQHNIKTGLREKYKEIQTDLRRRIHTDDPPNDVRTIMDHDSGFFTCVNGSFLSKYSAPYKSLKQLFNCQLRWRQEIGYRHDCMLNIDINFKQEQKVYKTSVKRYFEQVKYFDEFVSIDYQKSMMFLNKSDEVKLELYKKTLEFQCLAAKSFTLTSKIIGLDYRYGLQQKYGRFLYYLSPPSWRYKNRNFARSVEIEAKGFDFGISNVEDTFSVMFENLKRECYSGLVMPALYFQHPADLMELFDGIEQQHLHHFTHVVQLAPHATFFKKGIKLFKDIIAQDSAGVLNVIKHFKKLLAISEQQASQLETKFFKILNGLFYESVGAPEVLKLQTHLEFCFERLNNEKPVNMGIVTTAKALEEFYMDYSKRLEAVTSDKIKAAIVQYVESERRKFKRAKVAARELRQFDRLERELLKAFTPPAHRTQPVYTNTLHRSSRRKIFIKPKCEENRDSLTEAELEYLTLFTDWTEREDPANYLQSLNIANEEP